MESKSKIKVSDYIVQFIEDLGVKYVFLISGGGVIHIIDSVGRARKLKYICHHHEQAAAMAAEAYSRILQNIGVCIVTTGPGATNAITGVLGAWLDSIPVLIISGQVKREMMIKGTHLRQLGDQEINITDIVRPITKYSEVMMAPSDIRYHLEKAVYTAKEGRPGPVWIDVPLDIQGAYIDKDKLKKFDPKEVIKTYQTDKKYINKAVLQTLDKLKEAKRPVLYIGNGVRLAHAAREILALIRLLRIPVLTSFAGYDLVGTDNKYFMGRPGTVGQRGANFILQNSDLLLGLGTRLNIRSVGYDYQSFARAAYKIMVDIDREELHKKTVKIDLTVNCDAKDFIREMTKELTGAMSPAASSHPLPLQSNWLEKCHSWNKKYPVVLPKYWQEKKEVNPYCFVEALSRYLMQKDIIVVSNGTSCVVPYQVLTFPYGVRVIVNSGCAAMGYGLPAAIGACLGSGRKDIICLEGDGSIQMNLQELQTVIHHKLPIKIFVLNNSGYLSIRLTQDAFFKGKYVASNADSGVTCPEILAIARAYGFPVVKIAKNSELNKKIEKVLSEKGPILCEVVLSPTQGFMPKASSRKLPDGSFVSRPLEDMYPFLSRKELRKNMIIPLLPE